MFPLRFAILLRYPASLFRYFAKGFLMTTSANLRSPLFLHYHHVSVIRHLHVQHPTVNIGILIDIRSPDMFHIYVPNISEASKVCVCSKMFHDIGFFQAKHHVIIVYNVPCVTCLRVAQRRKLHHLYYLEPGITTGMTLQYAREHHVPMSRVLDSRYRQ